jgi:HTH-type transcriptional regulator/antitoxin HigA
MRVAEMVNVEPIRTEQDYENALCELECLIDDPAKNTDKIDVLTALIHSFEAQHHRPLFKKADPIDVILFVMEQRDLTRADLEPLIGSRGRVSDILTRKRPLTIHMIRRLSAGLNIPADLLITDYSIPSKAA